VARGASATGETPVLLFWLTRPIEPVQSNETELRIIGRPDEFTAPLKPLALITVAAWI
jgi:hypothetical protein